MKVVSDYSEAPKENKNKRVDLNQFQVRIHNQIASSEHLTPRISSLDLYQFSCW